MSTNYSINYSNAATAEKVHVIRTVEGGALEGVISREMSKDEIVSVFSNKLLETLKQELDKANLREEKISKRK